MVRVGAKEEPEITIPSSCHYDRLAKRGPPLACDTSAVTCVPLLLGAGLSAGFVITFALWPDGTWTCSPNAEIAGGGDVDLSHWNSLKLKKINFGTWPMRAR